jgi:hypothetical protein
MANFAELDENNVVLRVVRIGNDVPTSNGPLGENDMHPDGEKYCVNLFKGGKWKQTSFNNRFRKQCANLNGTYDEIKNIFIKPQPYPSWSLNSNNDWQSPVVMPTYETLQTIPGKQLVPAIWDEAFLRWKSYDILSLPENTNPTVFYYWNTDTSTWELY